MATKRAKQTARNIPAGGAYRKSYIGLRTDLDGLEIEAIRYYLRGDTTAERKKRGAYLKGLILDFMGKISERPILTDCPDGFTLCNGACVPYQCPDQFD